MSIGSFRCYEWKYCGPQFSCFVIITLSEDIINKIVKSEYFILSNDQNAALIQNQITPLRFSRYLLSLAIKFKGAKEALLVAEGHAMGTVFAAHQFTPSCQIEHSGPIKINSIIALTRWYQDPRLRQKILDIETRTCCEQLRQAINNVRQIIVEQ